MADFRYEEKNCIVRMWNRWIMIFQNKNHKKCNCIIPIIPLYISPHPPLYIGVHPWLAAHSRPPPAPRGPRPTPTDWRLLWPLRSSGLIYPRSAARSLRQSPPSLAPCAISPAPWPTATCRAESSRSASRSGRPSPLSPDLSRSSSAPWNQILCLLVSADD